MPDKPRKFVHLVALRVEMEGRDAMDSFHRAEAALGLEYGRKLVHTQGDRKYIGYFTTQVLMSKEVVEDG